LDIATTEAESPSFVEARACSVDFDIVALKCLRSDLPKYAPI